MKRDYQKPVLARRDQLGTIAALICPTSDPCVAD
jgi:hypothetical protein